MKRMAWVVLGLMATVGTSAWAQEEEITGASPRTSAIEFKLGSYTPQMRTGAATNPYERFFGDDSMLLFELELDRQLFQAFGSFGVGFSVGYAEVYGPARVEGTDAAAMEKTGLKVLPLRLLGVYRFDVAARRFNVPLVPFAKAGLVYTPWWVSKGSAGVEHFNGQRAAGGKWGYAGVLGLALMLDFFDPRLARDFDTSMGVNHSYLFAEYTVQNVDDFGGAGLDFSSRHWMFGLALEY